MLLLLLSLMALAGEVEDVHQLEWSRAPVDQVAAHASSDDAQVRQAAAVALGRSRDPAALEPLVALLGDPEVEVRRAAAEALGYTPGSAPAIRDALDAVTGLDDRVYHLRLMDSLGRQGDSSDVERLRGLLAQPWPEVVHGAEAVGRMARREVDGLGVLLPDLNRCARLPDPRTSEACSWALWRVGLDAGDENDLSRASWRFRTAPSPESRERLLRAIWPQADAVERRELFSHAMIDPGREVRVTALSLVQEGQVPVAEVLPQLQSTDPWVWEASVGALGRLGGDEAIEALEGQMADHTAYQQAAVVAALAKAGAGPAWSDELSVPVRLALLDGRDAEQLTQLATGDPSPVIRSWSAMVLAGKDPSEEQTQRLLSAEDAVVREVAMELKGEEAEALPVFLADQDPTVSGALISTTKGMIQVRLDPEVAPVAVANFVHLAQEDFYDGVVFHRVISGFVVQTGCPRGDGTGDPGWRIPDEVSAKPFDAGSLGMARGDYDTGGSQWFVTTGDHPHLEGEYTWFGHVSRGQEVVRTLSYGDVVLDVTILRDGR